ncbi:MAG: hypothetical protein OEY79_00305 [Anaplasmataceae bacterium]|nr:hypothetical protein [Anaplasmataceae bacterium]
MNNKKILVTNDDGIDSHGLIAIESLIKLFGGQDINTIAPSKDHSCCSHSISTSKYINFTKHTDKKSSINGTPVDCVLVGIERLKTIDAIFSGINLGANIGNDIFYSGTVAAAIRGSLNSIPSIAISRLHGRDNDSWDFLLKNQNIITKLKNIIEEYIENYTQNMILNINIPFDKIDNILIEDHAQENCFKRKYEYKDNQYYIADILNSTKTVNKLKNNSIIINYLCLKYE